jgi:hypothetical protein
VLVSASFTQRKTHPREQHLGLRRTLEVSGGEEEVTCLERPFDVHVVEVGPGLHRDELHVASRGVVVPGERERLFGPVLRSSPCVERERSLRGVRERAAGRLANLGRVDAGRAAEHDRFAIVVGEHLRAIVDAVG